MKIPFFSKKEPLLSKNDPSAKPQQASKQGKKPIGQSTAHFNKPLSKGSSKPMSALSSATSGLKGHETAKSHASFVQLEDTEAASGLVDLLGKKPQSTQQTPSPPPKSGPVTGDLIDLSDFDAKPHSSPEDNWLEKLLSTSSSVQTSHVGSQVGSSPLWKPEAANSKGPVFSNKQIKAMKDELLASPFTTAVRSLGPQSTIGHLIDTILARPYPVAFNVVGTDGSRRTIDADQLKAQCTRLMVDCKLTLTEVAAVSLYSSGAYKHINNQLRAEASGQSYESGDHKEAVETVTKEFKSALAKLPKPEAKAVYRSCDGKYPKTEVDKHSKGATVTYHGVTSTSTEKSLPGFITGRSLAVTGANRPSSPPALATTTSMMQTSVWGAFLWARMVPSIWAEVAAPK